MTPRNYTPTIIHITLDGETRLCRGKIPVTTWGEHTMNDKVAGKLPVCELCKIVYENEFGRQYVKGKTIARRRTSSANVIRTLNWYHNQCHTKPTNGRGC